MINNIPFPKPREINDNISLDLEDVILKALQRSPEDRYQNVDDFKEDIIQRVLKKKDLAKSSVIKIVEKTSTTDWLQKVITLYQSNHYGEAEKLLQYERDNGNDSQDLIYHIAYTYFYQKRYYCSLIEIEKVNIDRVEAIRREGFKDNLYSLKAKIYMELKKYDDAMMIYKYLDRLYYIRQKR